MYMLHTFCFLFLHLCICFHLDKSLQGNGYSPNVNKHSGHLRDLVKKQILDLVGGVRPEILHFQQNFQGSAKGSQGNHTCKKVGVR